jgi:hypothetical protein
MILLSVIERNFWATLYVATEKEIEKTSAPWWCMFLLSCTDYLYEEPLMF